MNKIKTLWQTILLMLCVVFVAGCNDSGEVDTPTTKSQINIKTATVVADSSGGEYTANYTITNPIEGEVITAQCDAEWVGEFDLSEAGVVRFVVAENEVDEERETTVKLTYRNADDVYFTVTQEAGDPSDFTFTFETVEQGYYACKVDVYPANGDTYFIMDLYSVDYLNENGIDSNEKLYEEHRGYQEYLAGLGGTSLKSLLDSKAKKGAQYGVKCSGLRPGGEAVILCYYYDKTTGQRISELTTYTVKAASLEALTEVEFNFDFSVDGPNATITATPEDYTGAYYFDVMPRPLVEEQCAELGCTPEEFFEQWWNKTVADDMSKNGTPGYLILQNYCSYGTDSMSVELLADTEYYAFALAVNDGVVCASVPDFETFRTEAVAQAELQIYISFVDLTAVGVRARFIASNTTDRYVIGYTTKQNWDSFGVTDSSRLDGIFKQTTFTEENFCYGDQELRIDRHLTPETSYVFFAFGYYGGVVTTQIFFKEVTTLPDEQSQVAVSVKHIGYFDIAAINALDPSFGFMDYANDFAAYPVEIEATDEDAKLYYYAWCMTPDSDPEWLTDENRLGRMLWWGERPNYLWTIIEYDTEAVIGAIAKDEDGNYSEHFLNRFPVTRDGVSDAQLFLDWQKEHNAVADASKYL